MMYIPSFIKTGSGIQKLIGGDAQTHRQHGDRINLLLCFQNKESRLKMRRHLLPRLIYTSLQVGAWSQEHVPCLGKFKRHASLHTSKQRGCHSDDWFLLLKKTSAAMTRFKFPSCQAHCICLQSHMSCVIQEGETAPDTQPLTAPEAVLSSSTVPNNGALERVELCSARERQWIGHKWK
jgi:hypothetical protein